MANIFVDIIQAGFSSLIDYLSFHVLLCLVPAFFIAGAMAVFIPKEMVMRYLGRSSPKLIAYPFAAIGGFLLAVCSCTVLPLFVGIWKKGAGLGPAITFLFAAPAINLLALVYTGTLIGMDIAIARGVLAIGLAITIGLIMEKLFPHDEDVPLKQEVISSAEMLKEPLRGVNVVNAFLIVLVVIAGLLLAFLNRDILTSMGLDDTFVVQTTIWVVGLLLLAVVTFGRKMDEAAGLFLWLVYILFTGTSQITYFSSDLTVAGLTLTPEVTNVVMKTLLTVVVSLLTLVYTALKFDRTQIQEWMGETGSFVKSIFPYIIVGVFLAGMVGYLIPVKLFQGLVGNNSVLANTIGVLFGVFMYFPTLMEVPIARMFLDLGMSRGVLLAYLLADPELSLQSILVTRKYLGNKRNAVYVLLVALFTVVAGLIFGLLVSGEPISIF